MIDKLNSIPPIQKTELNKTKISDKNNLPNLEKNHFSGNDSIRKYIAEYKNSNNLVTFRRKLILHVIKQKFGNELLLSGKGKSLIDDIESSLASHPDIEELVNSIIKEHT